MGATTERMQADQPSTLDQAALARELATEAIAILEGDRRALNVLALQIARAMFQYVGMKIAREQWKPTKQQKQALNRLRRQLREVGLTIHQLNPEYRRAIGNLTGFPDDKKAVRLVDLDKQLGDVAESTDLVLHFLAPPAGRRPDHGLEAAVRRLLPLFEKLAGDTATIVWNKPSGEPAEPGSRSTAALVQTIKRFPSPPSQTTILNMVDTVQRNPRSEMYDVEAEILRHFDKGGSPSALD